MNSELQSGDMTLVGQARALLSGQRDPIANAANLSALLFMSLENINWAGFYFHKSGELILGPFQGKPACVQIAIGKGVCGTAAASLETQRVADVHCFDGHIACDIASRSELVVPLVLRGELIGVLDIDSPVADRFSQQDQEMVEQLAAVYVDSID